MKLWVDKIEIEMYSTHNGVKSVVVERFIRTIKNKIYKYISSISKNVYIDKLDELVNKYKTYHVTIKTKPVHVKSNKHITFSKQIVRILKHKNIFGKGYFPHWSKEVFMVNLKTLCRGHALLVILKV